MIKQKTTEKFYVFFDVDGVLNCKTDWISKFTINSTCIRNFAVLKQELQKMYIPVFIITSTWRAGKGQSGENNAMQYDMLQKKLSEYGIEIFGSTPVSDKGRQREIEYYRKRFCDNSEHYLVLDDDESLFEHPESIRLYITDYKVGLTMQDVKKIQRKNKL